MVILFAIITGTKRVGKHLSAPQFSVCERRTCGKKEKKEKEREKKTHSTQRIAT